MRANKIFFKQSLNHLYSDSELEIIYKMLIEKIIGSTHFFDLELDENQLNEFLLYVEDLKKEIPVQYVLGFADFYGLTFKVNKEVLIPRPETEELVHLIINDNNNELNLLILDIGTGSGCIPISLKKNLPNAKISALDISTKALEIASYNAIKNNVLVDFIEDDALRLEAKNYPLYDIIVSNPPYIATKEMAGMQNLVTNHEPHLALFVDDNDPLIFYDKITEFAISNLKPNGTLYFEINQSLTKETQVLIESKGFKAKIIKDINQNDRIIKAQFLG